MIEFVVVFSVIFFVIKLTISLLDAHSYSCVIIHDSFASIFITKLFEFDEQQKNTHTNGNKKRPMTIVNFRFH